MAEEKSLHPYVLLEPPSPAGCNPEFSSGKFNLPSSPFTKKAQDVIASKVEALLQAHDDGESIERRRDLLADCFNTQFTLPGASFYARFFLGELWEESMTKAEVVQLLVEHNIPFMPKSIFRTYIAKLTERIVALTTSDELDSLPLLDRAPDYARFLRAHPPPGDDGSDGESNSSTANANADWRKLSMSTSKKHVPANDHACGDSGEDDDADENDSAKDNDSAKESKLRSELLRQKRKKRRLEEECADDESDDEHGDAPGHQHAHSKFLARMRVVVAKGLYIDFASLAPERMDQLKMLGANAKTSKRLTASTVLLTSASEADVKTLSNDFTAIAAGFLNGYIVLVSESPFRDAIARMKDRLAWWQWLTSFFGENKAAAVKFITRFVVLHSAKAYWLPVAENQCTLMVMKALSDCAPAPSSSKKNVVDNGSAKSTHRGGGAPTKRAQKDRVVFTAPQLAKLEKWRERFPNVCCSRMSKDFVCRYEKKGATCRWKHVCVWCSSATCKASCAQAEKF